MSMTTKATMSVPLLDLKAQYADLKTEIDDAVRRVMESTRFIGGPEITALEDEVARYSQCSNAVACASGTDALLLAMWALGIGPGDEVITSAYSFFASAGTIANNGATPVFVDVDPRTYNIDVHKIEAAITPRTKAIMPVHLYGQPADMAPILAIAEKHGIPVIEDACQSHGSEYHGRRCGSMGRLGCFSFYPGKNLGAYGEGGAVVTDDPALASKIRLLRAWGEETRYEHKYRGFNYRMDGIQGAVLGVKLKHLESWTEARRTRANTYARALQDTGIVPPVERPGVRHVYHVYVVRASDRDGLRARLTEAGVQTGVHYPIPVHLQPAYRDLGYSSGDFPVSERAAGDVLSLPIYPELTNEQIETIAGVCRASVPAPARG